LIQAAFTRRGSLQNETQNFRVAEMRPYADPTAVKKPGLKTLPGPPR
jgi:hypothetical protein